ncbi:MAG: response regulator [Desulfacinum sp.]|jgi:DNA-binding NtrC family response regulator|nr:response regulator [Desulfacinum sp.]
MAVRLLVVEEDERFRGSLCAWLRRRGYGVLEADGQQEALGLLEAEPVDVVLLGCREDSGQGWVLLDQTRAMDVPVILLVPKGRVQLSMEGMRRGAFDDLFVPFDWQALEDRIRAAGAARREPRRPRKSLKQRWEDLMVAAAFAEAGAPDVARRMLKKEDGARKGKREKKNG